MSKTHGIQHSRNRGTPGTKRHETIVTATTTSRPTTLGSQGMFGVAVGTIGEEEEAAATIEAEAAEPVSPTTKTPD
jgi:hypothetical protein